MNTPLVTVIVRSIGRPELARALASVASQTHPALEVVCVDALGEGHPRVAQVTGRVPIRLIGEGRRLGRSRAANLGLAAAGGEYLIFLDDDDWFLDHHVAALVEALAAHPDTRLAYADAEGVAPDGTVVHSFAEPFCPARLAVGNFIPINAALFARSLVTEGCAFDESLELYEDWDFWLQLARRTPFLRVRGVGARCSTGGGSGVGLSAERQRQREARARIYEKWRHLWTGQELEALVRYLEEEAQTRDRLFMAAVALAEQTAGELAAAAEQAAEARAALERVLGSRSWRWTTPLRWLGERLPRRGARGTPEGG